MREIDSRIDDHLLNQTVRIYEGLKRQISEELSSDDSDAGIQKSIEDINTKVNAIIDALGLEPVDASDTPQKTKDENEENAAEPGSEEQTDVFAVNEDGEPVSGGPTPPPSSTGSGGDEAEEPVHEGLDFTRVGESAINPRPTTGYTLIMHKDAMEKLGWTDNEKHFDTLNALMKYIASRLPMNYREYDVLRQNNFKYNSGTIFTNQYFDVQKDGE